jgi:hypothetical protein
MIVRLGTRDARQGLVIDGDGGVVVLLLARVVGQAVERIHPPKFDLVGIRPLDQFMQDGAKGGVAGGPVVLILVEGCCE